LLVQARNLLHCKTKPFLCFEGGISKKSIQKKHRGKGEEAGSFRANVGTQKGALRDFP